MALGDSTAALDKTIATLQGGVLQLGVGSAIPVIAGWEQTLSSSGAPELAAVAENLAALRTMLAAGDFDPAEAGRLLQILGQQTQAAATTPQGLPLAAPLTQLSLLLNTGGTNLVAQS